MKHITTGENWLFEIKEVRAIKAKKYGDTYEAMATLRVVDGVAHVEGLLARGSFTHKDKQELERYLVSLGFTEYSCVNFVDGEKIEINRATT